MGEADSVVLLDEERRPIGVADRTTVHTAHTPLHLAFSCHVRDAEGRVLVTRRALAKRTWPGVWSNAFCGHPRPGEDMISAIRRRGREELGLTLTDVRPLLPQYRYRAVDVSGIVENEVCPVFSAVATSALAPDPAEVCDHVWADPARVAQGVALTPFAFSPWFVEQLALLERT